MQRFLALIGSLAAAAAARAASPFDDAVAAWHLAGLEDSAGKRSDLAAVGAVRVGETLAGAEGEASRKRGGDGKAARLEGGWLDAGQGRDGELNIPGDQLTLLIRLRDPEGGWNTTLFSKHGGHRNLPYNLYTLDPGSGMELGFELGTERGMFGVQVPLEVIGPAGWHDVIARYDGKLLRLSVDGVPVRERPALGKLRTANTEPCIVGGEPHGGKVSRLFRGWIDHAALWARALSEAEVIQLAGGPEEVGAKEKAQLERTLERSMARLERSEKDPQRPRYHFLPPANWMNDPNGVCFWNGEYHLFYQHNPNGAFWGTMHWGHAKSKDLVRWTHLPMALAPTPGGPDWDGVWSGCFVDDGGVPTLFYTGVTPEVQCLATSKDGLLTWEKDPRNPVIARPPEGMALTGFRDPYAWKEGDGWYAVIGSGIRGTGGAALLYRSQDLRKWEYLHPLLVGKKEHGEMWECPNFFPLGGKHVLLVSVHGTVLYFTGTHKDHRFTPEVEGSTDYGGHFYAAQAFEDGKGRRLLFGWITEGRGDREQRAAGWSGAQSLPRVLTLLPDGRLGMEPAEEVRTLRGKRHAQFDGIRGNRLEILAEIEPGDAPSFGLFVLEGADAAESTRIAYEPGAGQLSIEHDGRARRGGPLTLQPGETLRLNVFLDGSTVEVFANGRACLTGRVYRSPEQDRLGYFFNAGGKVHVKLINVWELNP